MLMKRLLAFFAIATFGITTLSAENVETVYSPDGKVKLSFSLSEEGRPQYSVDCGELPAVLTSGMGFELVGKSDDLKSHLDRDFWIGTLKSPVHLVAIVMRRGVLYGVRRLPSEIIITNL